MTYIIVVLVAIIVGGAWFGRWVLGSIAVDRHFLTSSSPEAVLSLAEKKLKGVNPFARVTREDNAVRRSWEKAVMKAGTSTTTLQVTARSAAANRATTTDPRWTHVVIEALDVSYPRVAFFLSLPQASWTALRRRKAIIRAIRQADSSLFELSSTERAALESGDLSFLTAPAIEAGPVTSTT